MIQLYMYLFLVYLKVLLYLETKDNPMGLMADGAIHPCQSKFTTLEGEGSLYYRSGGKASASWVHSLYLAG